MEQIRIDIEPSFDPPEYFEMFLEYDKLTKAPCHCFKFQIYPDSQPTHMKDGQIKLSDVQYQRVVEVLKKIEIGILPSDDSSGLDGTTTRVGMIQGNNRIQLEWWEEAPIEWKPLEKLIKMLSEIARQAAGLTKGR